MNNLKFLIISFLLYSLPILAEKRAVTDEGDEVILYDNGKWKYLNDKSVSNDLKVNKQKFKKDKQSTFLLKSKINKTGTWINTKKWGFKKLIDNSEGEYEFNFKDGDLYGKVINEEIYIPLKNLKEIALINAKSAAADARIVTQEYRTVNGVKVLHLEINGTLKGINFTYLGYYYADQSGTTQIVIYTGNQLIKKYKKDIYKLLNGFTLLKK